jgi:ferric-dicitrate binding protein FerR (iron transport regulator)
MTNYGPYYHIAALIAKDLQEGLTGEEKIELEDWLQSDLRNRELFKKLLDETLVWQPLEIYTATEKEDVWKIIAENTVAEKKIKKQRLSYFLPYAAAALLLFGITIKFTGLFSKNEVQKLSAKHPADFLPGGNKAILILSNGTKIFLDDKRLGKIARQQNILIDNTISGEVIYAVDNAINGNYRPVPVNLLSFNTIETPRGGQYEVVLPDGTKVWLNAASSLKYPVTFGGKSRGVDLTGEAYFEVAKNAAKPFFVKTRSQTVEVLGTHFNINSYADEKDIKTTLFEGRVKVTGNSNLRTVKLVPGQQAVNRTGKLTVIRNADTDEALAWKNGKFLFHDTGLKTIMRQISRWYDVDVEYQGHMAAMHYSGRIARNVPISQIFGILKTSGINFTINGRKIIVTP